MIRRVIVERLEAVLPEEREGLLRSIGAAGAHERAMRALPALQQIEVGGAGATDGVAGTFEVVAWNLERGTHLDAALDVLAARRPQVVLATELDAGMARSGNRHTAADLAASLEHAYAFGVEFVELGLGDASEVARLGSGAANERGFHGNAITAASTLDDPLLVRIEEGGSWFNAETDQPRVGGRMAVAARVVLGGGAVVVCSVHLESESDPVLRAEQLTVVVQAIDESYGSGPCVIGGDLNTFSGHVDDVRDRFRELRDEDPSRFCWPVPYEPLFEAAAVRGFEVEAANAAEQTMRLSADQRPGSLLRLDWLLVRGLEVVDRSTVPAIDLEGQVISDHDAVTATLRHVT
jgi:endonuclease/exonuclease/phosphatase family metal-dependent hydrolase